MSAAPRRLPLSTLVWYGAWFALLTGIGEALILFTRRFALTQTVWVTGDFVWMAPIAYLLFMMMPGLAIAAITRITSLRAGHALAAGGMALLALGVVSLVLFGGKMHLVAHFAVALGGAVQVGRFAARENAPLAVLARRSLPWLASLIVVAGTGVRLSDRLDDRPPGASVPRAGAPNVLLLIWDTVRSENLSVYGYPRPTTPLLERRAADAVTFDWALSTAPWTAASHASMFTGRLTQEMSVGWRTPLDRRDSTLAEVLGKRGWRTGGFTANLIATTRESGLARGFGHYEDLVPSLDQLLTSTFVGQRIRDGRRLNAGPLRMYDHKPAGTVSDAFLSWVDGNPGEPFFAFLNYFDAHDPYFPGPGWKQKFDSGDQHLDKYDAALLLLDAELERLRSELEARGLLHNTIIILASDHGELFGEHGLHQHGNSLYLPLLHVPLMIWGPTGLPRGTRIEAPASLRDLPATILALADPSGASPFPGHSLTRFWTDSLASSSDTLVAGAPKGIGTPAHEPVTRGDMNALFANGTHYILNGDGIEELYRIPQDPGEEHNLAADSTEQATMARFRAALAARVPAAWRRSLPGGPR